MYIVGFNGPPQSGKDTLAAMLGEIIESKHDIPLVQTALSVPLRQIAFAMVGRLYVHGVTDPRDYERFKNESFPQYGNRTGRQLMIDVSERFLKEIYDREIMVQLLLNNSNFDGVMLIADMGFQIEVNPMLAKVGTRNVYFVRVEREGCSFDNDSREWVNHHDSGCSTTVWNNGMLDDLRTEARRIYGRLLNQMAWKF